MRDPLELVEFLGAQDYSGAVLIEAMDGFMDAGHALRIARDHLTESFNPERVVRFEVDELLDHRSRRPELVFDVDHWASYDAPSLSVELLRDSAGAPFFLLAGPEPDIQWERFAAAVGHVVERLGVGLTIGLHAVPWAAPHTRPIDVTSFGRPRELLERPPLQIGKVRVPGSAGHLIEYRLAERGRPAIGLAAHVPYYLAHVEYPAATAALLAAVERAAGLSLSVHELQARGAETLEAIEAQVAGDEQAQAVIRELESRAEADEPPLRAEDLPSGDELGAAFERFLADRTPPGRDEPAE